MMEKMQIGIDAKAKQSKEGLLKNLSQYLRKLKLIGVVVGGMFLGVDNISAQNMQEGTISADSAIYKMTESENREIQKLTKNVEDLVHDLQGKLKKNTPVMETVKTINDTQIGSTFSHVGDNVEVGAKGSWVVDFQGDTFKLGSNWAYVADTLDQYGNGLDQTRDSYYFEKSEKGDDTEIHHYTKGNDSELGESTVFHYGSFLKEENAVIVENFKEIPTENQTPQGTMLMFDKNSADNGYTKLVETLNGFKEKLEEAIEKVND